MYSVVLEYMKKDGSKFREIDDWLQANCLTGNYATVGDGQGNTAVHASVAIYLDDKDTYKALLAWMVDRFPQFHPQVAIDARYAQLGATRKHDPGAFHHYVRSVWMNEHAQFRKMGTVEEVTKAVAKK